MNLLYKECEVCGAKINKFQSWWNIYALKAGKTIKCSKCNTDYTTNKFISLISKLYSFWGPLIFVVFIVSFLDSFKFHLGGEVWLYAIILYNLIELLVMVVLPLKKIESI